MSSSSRANPVIEKELDWSTKGNFVKRTIDQRGQASCSVAASTYLVEAWISQKKKKATELDYEWMTANFTHNSVETNLKNMSGNFLRVTRPQRCLRSTEHQVKERFTVREISHIIAHPSQLMEAIDNGTVVAVIRAPLHFRNYTVDGLGLTQFYDALVGQTHADREDEERQAKRLRGEYRNDEQWKTAQINSRHAVFLIGYRKLRPDASSERFDYHFLCKGSWGESFGHNGRAYIKLSDVKQMEFGSKVYQLTEDSTADH